MRGGSEANSGGCLAEGRPPLPCPPSSQGLAEARTPYRLERCYNDFPDLQLRLASCLL